MNGDFLLKVLVPNIIPDNEVDRGKLRETAWRLLVRHHETILALALELTRVREMDKNPHVNSNSSVDPDISAQGRLYQSPRFDPQVSTVEPGAIKTPAVEKTLGHIEAVIENLPARGAAQYDEMLKGFASRAYAREMNGSGPEVVARAVRHALTARRPRTRY